MKSSMTDYAKDEIIFRNGEIGNTAYILTEGSIEISISEGKNKTVLAILKPVSVFGEMALLLGDQKRTASARAIVPSKVATISKKDFNDFVDKSPKLITAVLKAIVLRLQQTTERVTHSPELYTVITETLGLFIQHDKFTRIKCEAFGLSIATSFKVDEKEVYKTLNFLETIGLIELRTDGEQTFINIVRPIDFIKRAKQIYKTFSKMGVSPDKGLS